MSEGTKWDHGKVDWTFLPSSAMEEVLKIYMGGAAKYGRGNYLHGISYSRVFAAALRHLWSWWRGEDLDPESGRSHLAHAVWNCLTLLEYVMSKDGRYAGFDDRAQLQSPPPEKRETPWTGTITVSPATACQRKENG